MWLRIAARDGCTVEEAQRRYDSAAFSEQCALYTIDPWGEERMDLRFAQLCMMVARPKKGKRVKLSDFMFKFGERELREQSPQEMAAILKAVADSYKKKK